MFLKDADCDYCTYSSAELLIDKGGPVSAWCGYCFNGCLEYFEGSSTEDLIAAVLDGTKALEDNPIDYDEYGEVHDRKVWIHDEIERAKRELIRRLVKGVE